MNNNLAPTQLRRRNAYNQLTNKEGYPIDEDGFPINEDENPGIVDDFGIAPTGLRRRNAYNQLTNDNDNPISGGELINPDNSHNPALLSSNQGAVVGYIGSSNKVDAAMGKGVH